jgi:hypothetical protein
VADPYLTGRPPPHLPDRTPSACLIGVAHRAAYRSFNSTTEIYS